MTSIIKGTTDSNNSAEINHPMIPTTASMVVSRCIFFINYILLPLDERFSYISIPATIVYIFFIIHVSFLYLTFEYNIYHHNQHIN
ncbi:hypothetical protein SLEP1_g1170 [Rubroshorea leprosula]|uniref:Uncharacterized protein n=1 Tax=Rubroshorea leprosula TaxID=152421 RepID=A0AAV5HCZ2_9ROSI|nr:hypothetical protein SLEP1_g1170 [Rubroshorea leprosula]